MEDTKKIALFEQAPIPKAVAQLAIPTILSSLVMVLYNLADTYFVGMLGNPVENAAVALAAPVLLAFNAVNNLFGVGSSSMMSRAMGRKDYEMDRLLWRGSRYLKCGDGLPSSLRRGGPSRQRGNHERLHPEYHPGSLLHHALGPWHGGRGG